MSLNNWDTFQGISFSEEVDPGRPRGHEVVHSFTHELKILKHYWHNFAIYLLLYYRSSYTNTPPPTPTLPLLLLLQHYHYSYSKVYYTPTQRYTTLLLQGILPLLLGILPLLLGILPLLLGILPLLQGILPLILLLLYYCHITKTSTPMYTTNTPTTNVSSLTFGWWFLVAHMVE